MIDISKELGNINLFQAWGQATGKIHRLTKSYLRPPEIAIRKDSVVNFQAAFAPWIPHEPRLQANISRVVQAVRDLPKTEDWYGLIHSDIHSHNFFYDGELHIFDFDDCCYHQLASDIAMPLYYSTWGGVLTPKERDALGYVFARNFLTGYLREQPFSLEQALSMPLLLRFRDCELLGALLGQWGDNLNDRQGALIEAIRTRILEEHPVVNVDWDHLIRELGFN